MACGAAAVVARGGGRLVAARWPASSCGSPWSQMCFRVTKTSGRGAPPDPRTTFRAPQAGRPTWSILRKRVRSRTAWLPPATIVSRRCAAMPNSPAASQSANGSSAASKRRSTPFRDGLLVWERPEGAGPGVRKRARPRTRSRPSDWGVASVTALVPRTPRANGAGRPKDFAAPADKREGRCASPDGQSAHRPPVSFARFSTALGRSADYPPTPLQRTASLVPVLLPCSARTPWDARPASKTKHGFVARTTAGKPKLLHGSSAIRSDDPRQALRRRWRSSFNGLVEPVPCARNLMCIAIRFSDGSQCPERRSMADRGTPAAPALACQSANSTADTRAVTTTVPRSGITPHKGEGAAPRRPLSEPVAPLSLATPRQLSNQHPVTRTRSATW